VSGPAEFGGSLAAWKQAYPEDSCSASDSSGTIACMGPAVTGSESGSTWQFQPVYYADGIVNGFTENFSDGTTLNDVEAALYQVMPSDTKIIYFHVTATGASGNCAFLNMQSATLARIFANGTIGNPQGIVGVEVNSSDSNYNLFYSATNIQEAIVDTVPNDATTTC
jgi:hypothetical protein